MDHLLKQAIGIDCAKQELVCCVGQLRKDFTTHLKATSRFANTAAGIGQLADWADRILGPTGEAVFVVEATGVYHQKLAYQLYGQGRRVAVVLPNRARYFAKTLKVSTVTDRTASKALARMGLEKDLELWQPPHRLFSRLKELTRERKRLNDQLTTLKNQRHAAEVATETMQTTLDRLDERQALCVRHIEQIEAEITTLIGQDEELSRQFEYVCSIKGVGLMTAAVVVSETDGFNLIRNVRQLVSYAGYDVVEKQSGTSVRGKPRISKQGNSYIRRALYFPALTAARTDDRLGSFYERLYGRHAIKMKAYTAVQRKLLILIYTLWNKRQMYDPEYHHKKVGQPQPVAPHELA